MEVPAVGNRFERFISARKIQAVLGFAGIGIIHGLMINLPLALVAKDYWRHYWTGQWSSDWSPEQFGFVYSSYFCGYLLSTQLIGLARFTKFKGSPKWVMLLAVLINIIWTLFTPIIVTAHYFALVFVRFNMGVAGGIALSALNIMLSKWTLPEERAYTRTLVHKSELFGFSVSIFLTGAIGNDGAWYTVFYVMGGLSLIWCILWIVFAQDTPQQQPFISVEERNKIVNALEKYELDLDEPVPWGAVIISKPFLATLTVYVCSTWGLYLMLFKLPEFLTTDIRMYVIEIGLTISLSLVGSWVISMGLDKCLNYIREKNVITSLAGRKITVTCATAIPALLLLLMCFINPYYGTEITLFVFTIMFTGSIFYGHTLNYHDIAPNFAEQLMDVTNTILINVRILVPIVMAGLADSGLFLFILTAVLYVIACFVYLIFGSTTEEPWNKTNVDDVSYKGQFINA